MNAVYSRTVAWVLMSLALGLLAWTLDLQDANVAAAQATRALEQQVRRARASAQPVAAQPSATDSAEVTALAQAWRKAAQSHGSDARNTAAMLERVKSFCETSGLKECQIRRSNVRTSGMTQTPRDAFAVPGSGPGTAASDGVPTALSARLAPHAMNVLARFDAQGVNGFARALAESGLLYRMERVNIVQNRAEWDVVFYLLSSEAAITGSTVQALNK